MRRGYTLVEVLVAGAILVTGLVPILTLLTTGSSQVVKARDRTTAMALAGAVAEEMRMRRPLDQVSLPATAAAQVPYLKPLVDAYEAAHPEYAAGLDQSLANFSVSATIDHANLATPLHVEVTWSEAGQPKSYGLDGTLGGP